MTSVSEPDVSPQEPENYHERSAFNDAMKGAGTCAMGGLFVSAVQNALSEHKQGAVGVFTRTGGTIALFTAMGGIFSATDSFVANAREKEDSLNGAVGGCAAGLVAGASSACCYEGLSRRQAGKHTSP